MSTHGNILILDEDDGGARETCVWLHAFSSGDTKEVYEMITTLPEWLIQRARLANGLNDPSLGPGWWIRQFNNNSFDYALAPYCEIWKSSLASLICARYVNRWCPMIEKEAPWHKVGDPPDLTIMCYGSMFTVHPKESKKFKAIEIHWIDRIRKELMKERCP